MTRRTERVAELLRGEVAQCLRREASDPRVRLVTLTRVDVAPDFSQALVFWSHLDPEADTDDAQRGLDAAASFLRGRLARTLSLKRVPKLVFRHDRSIAEGAATLALLKEISDGEEG